MTKRVLWATVVLLVVALPAHGAERGSDAQVRDLIQSALDEAFKNQIERIFATWLRDSTGQPHRASAGVRKAVAAYRHAVQAIENERLTWHQR